MPGVCPMTTFRPDTSFPYLKIARECGVEIDVRGADKHIRIAVTHRRTPMCDAGCEVVDARRCRRGAGRAVDRGE